MTVSSIHHTLPVAAIKNGTVIDHVPVGVPLKILDILKLPMGEYQMTIGLNFPSKRLGKKGMIKIQGRELTAEEVNQVALFAPQATINIIKNYQVVKKFNLEIPKMIQRIIVCPNPTCITNHEQMESTFFVHSRKKNIQLQCQYCEKYFEREEIRDYKT